MRFLAKKCENIAKSRQKMIPGSMTDKSKTIVLDYELECDIPYPAE